MKTSITNEVQLKKSKLQAKKEHLEALLSKRARLDYEIRLLKKSLSKTSRAASKTLTERFEEIYNQEFELYESVYSRVPQSVERAHPGISDAIEDFNEICVDIQELVRET